METLVRSNDENDSLLHFSSCRPLSGQDGEKEHAASHPSAFEDETLNYQSTSAVEAPWAMNIRYDREYALGNRAIKETTHYLVELRYFGCKLSAARIPKMKL
jgi:hypothetical protein